jgi:hypothetical protein
MVAIDALSHRAASVVTRLRKTPLFLSLPYVCPEPVLVKRSFLYINGAESGVLVVTRRLHAVEAQRHWVEAKNAE